MLCRLASALANSSFQQKQEMTSPDNIRSLPSEKL